MSAFTNISSGLALLVSIGSAYYSKRANDRADVRETPPVFFLQEGRDLILLNTGSEAVSSLAWSESGKPRERAILDPKEWQRIGDIAEVMLGKDKFGFVVSLEYPAGQAWETTVTYDSEHANAPGLHWNLRKTESRRAHVTKKK